MTDIEKDPTQFIVCEIVKNHPDSNEEEIYIRLVEIIEKLNEILDISPATYEEPILQDSSREQHEVL
jgi:hypothetical protein